MVISPEKEKFTHRKRGVHNNLKNSQLNLNISMLKVGGKLRIRLKVST